MGFLTALSSAQGSGIPALVNGSAPRRILMSWLAVSLACLAGCDLSPLKSGDLFTNADAARPPGERDGGGRDAGSDQPPDGDNGDVAAAHDGTDEGDALVATDVRQSGDVALDPSDDAGDPLDAAARETGNDAACAVSCDEGTFCNTLVGKCQPSNGHSMLSGVITDACDRSSVAALLGIAGQHQCGYTGKGAYFFSSLPVGLLELAVVKPGYLPYTKPVQIVEGGNIQDVVLTRADDPNCSGARPVDKGCSCDGSVCTP